jgi:hypothetical protein
MAEVWAKIRHARASTIRRIARSFAAFLLASPADPRLAINGRRQAYDFKAVLNRPWRSNFGCAFVTIRLRTGMGMHCPRDETLM